MFRQGTELTNTKATQQLFQCCDESLGNDLLRENLNISADAEQDLLADIKRLAVIPVAESGRRSDLLAVKQSDGENVRLFSSRIKRKAATCAYSIACHQVACHQQVDFTDVMLARSG